MEADFKRRIALLEEALAECLVWVTEQDVYPLDATDEAAWLDEVQTLPLLAERDPDEVREAMRAAVDLVDRGERTLGGTEAWQLALARANMRRRVRPAGD